jgi:hypothetical protein
MQIIRTLRIADRNADIWEHENRFAVTFPRQDGTRVEPVACNHKTQRDAVTSATGFLSEQTGDRPWKDKTAEEREAIRLERQRDHGVEECSQCGNTDDWDSLTEAEGRLWCEECFQEHMGERAEAEELAAEFSRMLRETLSTEEMAEVKARNAVEQSPDVCHSHDFCDANMVMDAAGKKLGLWSADLDINDQSNMTLWNTAWNIAKCRGFATGVNRG